MRRLLERLLAVLAAECPAAWSAMAALEGLSLSLRIEGEAFGLEVGGGGARVTGGGEAQLRLACDRATLRELILGEPLGSALREDRLQLFGAPNDLVRLDELVRLLVAGAARSPAAEPLFDELMGGMSYGE